MERPVELQDILDELRNLRRWLEELSRKIENIERRDDGRI